MKLKPLVLSLSLLAGIATPSALAKEQLNDLTKLLNEHPEYKEWGAHERLKFFADFNKKYKVGHSQYQLLNKEISAQVKALYAKFPKDPVESLKAFDELAGKTGWKKDYSGLNYSFSNDAIIYVTRYLKRNEEYAKASTMGKLEILQKIREDYKSAGHGASMFINTQMYLLLINDKSAQENLDFIKKLDDIGVWQGSSYEFREMAGGFLDQVTVKSPAYKKLSKEAKLAKINEFKEAGYIKLQIPLDGVLDDLLSGEKAIDQLKLLKNLNDKRILLWGNYLSAKEPVIIKQYMAENKEFQKMTPLKQLEHIGDLHSEKLFTSFARRTVELPIAEKYLLSLDEFKKADREGKKKILTDMKRKDVINEFTRGDLERKLAK